MVLNIWYIIYKTWLPGPDCCFSSMLSPPSPSTIDTQHSTLTWKTWEARFIFIYDSWLVACYMYYYCIVLWWMNWIQFLYLSSGNTLFVSYYCSLVQKTHLYFSHFNPLMCFFISLIFFEPYINILQKNFFWLISTRFLWNFATFVLSNL